MVVYSVSILNKKGKILLARQFVQMTRLKIEGWLAAFPKLISADSANNNHGSSSGKQHTYLETDDVRYVYQPMDNLYLVLITNLSSNILEDLSTLRMIAKLIPEYCGGHDEDTVAENAFELIFALDEVITPMGHREQVTFKQIQEFVDMDSAEAKLNKIIEDSKVQNQKDIMKKKAAEFEKRRIEENKLKMMQNSGGGFGSSSLGRNSGSINWSVKDLSSLGNSFASRITGGSGTGNYSSMADGVTAISSETYMNQYNNNNNNNNNNNSNDVKISNDGNNNNNNNNSNDYHGFGGGGPSDDNEDHGSYKPNKKKSRGGQRAQGLKLGGGKRKDDAIFSEQRKKDQKMALNEKLLNPSTNKYLNNNNDELLNEENKNLLPVEISISEKMTIIIDRDGVLKKFDIKGDMEVVINDPDASKAVIQSTIKNSDKNNDFGKVTWRLHPRMNSNLWKKSNILCLKDNNKSFKIGRSSKTSILKWRMSTNDENNIPLTFNYWPELDRNKINISADYRKNNSKDVIIHNVIITIPIPHSISDEPEIKQINGDYSFNRRDHEIQWILGDLVGNDDDDDDNDNDNDDDDNEEKKQQQQQQRKKNSSGSLELSLDISNGNIDMEDLYPVSVHFEIRDTYSGIKVPKVIKGNSNEDEDEDEDEDEIDDKPETKKNKKVVEYKCVESCITEKYVVQ